VIVDVHVNKPAKQATGSAAR